MKNSLHYFKALFLLTAMVLTSGNVWGNRLEINFSSDNCTYNSYDFVGNGNVTFSFSSDNLSCDDRDWWKYIKQIKLTKAKTTELTWTTPVGYTVNVTGFSIKAAAGGNNTWFAYTANAGNKDDGAHSKKGTSDQILQLPVSDFTPAISSVTVEASGSSILYIKGFSVDYTLTPNAPSIVSGQEEHNCNAWIVGGDNQEVDLKNVFSRVDAGHTTLTYECNSANSANASINNGVFSATVAGDYTVRARIVALANCHEASAWSNTITIHVAPRVSKIAPEISNTFSTYYVDDATIDLRALWTSTSDGAITYSLVSFTPLANAIHSGAVAPSLTDGHLLSLGQAGTARLSLHQEEGTAHLALESDAIYDLVISKRTPVINWYADPIYFNSNYPNIYTVEAGDPALFSIVSSDVQVASVAGTTLTTYNKQASTTLTVTAVENYKWAGETFEKVISPVVAPIHLPLAMNNEAQFNVNKAWTTGSIAWNQDKNGIRFCGGGAINYDNHEYDLHFEGIPDKLSFSTESSSGISSCTYIVYESVDGSNWGTAIWNSTDRTNNQTLSLKNDTRYVKLHFNGNYYAYITNITITELKKFEADKATLDFQTCQLNHVPAVQSFVFSHANAGYTTTVTAPAHYLISFSENSGFEQSLVIPNTGGDKMGDVTIYVKYLADAEGEHNSNIQIADNLGNTETVALLGTTAGKIATNIVWEGKGAGEYYSTADGEVANPFRVYDANGDLVEDAVITISSSNSYVASVSDDGKTSFTPYCGGEVILSASYAGNEKYLPSNANHTIQVALCEGMLVWDQNLMAFTDQDIDKPSGTIAMNAVLKDEHDTEITGVTYTYTVDDMNVATVSGNTLTIVGVGETRVNVTTSEVVSNNKTYQSLTSSLIVRVRQDGADCASFYVSRPEEHKFGGDNTFYSVEWDNPTRDLIDAEIPFSFDVKTSWGAARSDGLTIYYKSHTFTEWTRLGDEISGSLSNSYTTISDRALPADATGVQFRYTGVGWGDCYIQNLNIRQKTYFTASVSSITELAEVNADFNAGFSLRYSDVPAIRYELRNVSTSDGLPHGLTITPAVDEITNSCGEYGTIDFHIYGRWNRARTITANLAIWTSADPENPIVIPVSITVRAGATYTFTNGINGQGDNLWTTPSNWNVNDDYTHGTVPGSGNPVTISAPIVVNDVVDAYSVRVNNDGNYENGDITIAATGGLTVHNGGIVCSRNIIIKSNEAGSGFFRMSPDARVLKVGTGSTEAIMPNATVEYTTRSTLSTGANKDATWQYFGVPFESYFTVDYNTWLYLWDEQSDWVSLRDQSQPVSLQPWKGYAITQYGQPTYSFAGQMLGGPLDPTKTITFTKTGGELTSGMNGDNLWANSYCSPIDVKNFTAADFSSVEASDIDLTFYIFNSGSWNQWDGVKDASGASPGQYTSIPVLSAGDLGSEAQTLIAPMQGVYTHVNNNGVTMTLDYAKHVWNAHATKAQMTAPMRIAGRVAEDTDSLMNESDSLAVDSASLFRRVRMAVSSNNSGADHLYLLERPAYTAAYDNGYDALKIFAETPGSVGIYTSEQGGQMAVSATGNMDSLFVGVQAGDDTEYHLQISAVVGDSLYLKDMQTNTLIPLVDGATYAFVMNAKSNDEKRFLVVDGYRHMVYSPVATGIGEHLAQPAPVVNKFMRQGQLFILRDGVLYDAVGRKIK